MAFDIEQHLPGYEVVTSALAASEDFRCLSVQFEIEQSRLNNFIEAAGLKSGVDEAAINATFLNHKVLLMNILSEIESALTQLTQDPGKRQSLPAGFANPTISSDLSDRYDMLSKRLSATSPRPVEKLGLTRSLVWSTAQKGNSEKYLQRLGRFNDFLHELLDIQQSRSLQDQQRQSYMEFVQTRNSLADIQRLSQAAHAVKIVHTQSNIWQRANDAELENLAAFKALYMSILADTASQPSQIKIPCSQLQFYFSNTKEGENPRATYKTDGQTEREVWINWQDGIPANNNTSAPSTPIAELAVLLMAPKPDEFCIPPCIGYCEVQQAGSQPRRALIFENPIGVDPQIKPVSLAHAIEHHAKPCLADRIALAHKIAQCLLYLHAANWLHKALRSTNILFFQAPNLDLDVRNPYVTGFDNSRRSRFNEATGEVPHIGRMEVYRHPDTQSSGAILPYRKTFDIYSLGLVLVEIALWRPIVSIMGIDETVDRSPRATVDIQKRWLVSEPRLFKCVRGEVGNRYTNAVETCLKGRDAFAIDRRDIETSAATGLTIQREFNSRIVRILAEIVV